MPTPENPNSPGAKKPKPANRLLSFPSKEMPHSILMVFKKYKYRSVEEGFKLNKATVGSGNSQRSSSNGVDLQDSVAIQLPFPTGLVDSTSLRVGGFERDPATESLAAMAKGVLNDGMTIGDAFNSTKGLLQTLGSAGASATAGLAAGGGQGFLQGAMDMGAGLMKDIAQTDVKNLTAGAAYLLRSKLPGDIGKSVDIALGTAINPRETLAFEGVNLKTHAFSWELFPSNKQDSTLIRSIINTIKRNSLPSVDDLQIGSGADATVLVSKAFLDYPSTVDIYLLGVNQEHFIKFKTCMVNEFSVDYGGGGVVSIIKGGKPARVTLSMSLSELQIHTADDYEDGLSPETETEETNPVADGDTTGGQN